MFKILSYPIKDGDPTWPGNPTCSLEPHTSIAKGDTANTATIHLFNHYGTHMDGPMHFNPNGISLDKVPVERFFYQKPLVIDVPKKAGEKILTEDLIPYKDQIAQADFLFLRTGFWKKRKSDPSVYENNGPAVGSAAATYLRENFPSLKAIGLDFVSLASYSDGKDGDLAHQIMLGMYKPGYICIVEDINMEELPEGFLKQAAAVPLIIVGIDSCPVTMWAEF